MQPTKYIDNDRGDWYCYDFELYEDGISLFLFELMKQKKTVYFIWNDGVNVFRVKGKVLSESEATYLSEYIDIEKYNFFDISFFDYDIEIYDFYKNNTSVMDSLVSNINKFSNRLEIVVRDNIISSSISSVYYPDEIQDVNKNILWSSQLLNIEYKNIVDNIFQISS